MFASINSIVSTHLHRCLRVRLARSLRSVEGRTGSEVATRAGVGSDPYLRPWMSVPKSIVGITLLLLATMRVV